MSLTSWLSYSIISLKIILLIASIHLSITNAKAINPVKMGKLERLSDINKFQNVIQDKMYANKNERNEVAPSQSLEKCCVEFEPAVKGNTNITNIIICPLKIFTNR